MGKFKLDDFLLNCIAKGKYSIIFDEIKQISNLSDKAIHQALFRAKQKNKIISIRQGFYAIIPPEYSDKKILPAHLFIDDMMKSLNKDYYIALFSAAAMFGAGHQQPMNFQIIIEPPTLRKIKKNNLNIIFYTKKGIDKEYITQIKTASGFANISSKELTIIDLLIYHKKIGGINRIATIIEELIEDIDTQLLLKIIDDHNLITVLQRLGYILENVIEDINTANILYHYLENKNYKNIPLSLLHPNKGDINDKWKIIINTEIEL